MNESSQKIISENEVIQVKNCEEALSYIYNKGKYQKLAMILLTICYTCTGSFITNSLIFIQKDPKIECLRRVDLSNISSNQNSINDSNKDNSIKYLCLRKEACDQNDKNLISYEFIYEKKSYFSWINDFKLGCDKGITIGLFSSIFFIGGFISSLISSSLSDYIGRSKLIKISMIARSIMIAFIILFPSVNTILFSMFILGLLNSMHSTIPYILLSEYMDKENRDDYLTYMFIFESFSGILGTFFFFILQNWLVFFILNLLYGLVFVYYSDYLFESPRYLYSKNLFQETKEILEKISVINLGFPVRFLFENELKLQIEEENKNVIEVDKRDFFSEILDIFKSEKYKLYILVMPLIWFMDAFAFFAIYFMIKYINNNIYIMNIILFISEGVSYKLSNHLSKIYGKRDCMIYSFIISAVSFILFYFSKDNSFFTLLLIFTAKFGAAVVLNISSIYTNECFPTAIRGRSTAICSFLGKFGGIIAPILVEMTKSTAIISSLFCFFAAGILIPLKNNIDRVEFLDDHIEEMEKRESIKNKGIKDDYLNKYKKPDFDFNNQDKSENAKKKISSEILKKMINDDKDSEVSNFNLKKNVNKDNKDFNKCETDLNKNFKIV